MESHQRVLSIVVMRLYLYFIKDYSDYHLNIGFGGERRAMEIVPAREKLHRLNSKRRKMNDP